MRHPAKINWFLKEDHYTKLIYPKRKNIDYYSINNFMKRLLNYTQQKIVTQTNTKLI